MGCENSQVAINAAAINQPPGIVEDDKNEHFQQRLHVENFSEAQKVADEYFRMGEFVKAIDTYKRMIQKGYSVDFEIEGLGHSDLSISFYEWNIYEWYDKNRREGKIRGNAFDALSLCLNHVRNTHTDVGNSAIIWYEDMLGQKQSIELYIGYANILNNRCRYEEAIKMYNKVIKLRPTMMNAQASLALLYEYRRIEKSKSVALAKNILELDPKNMYALYILARNQQNIDVKIQKLKEASELFPDYVRIANDIGIAYGSKKEHQQAIIWYKKCLEKAPKYAAAFNNVGVRTEMLKRYEQALPWYLRACELDPEYKAAHGNAIDIFDQLKFSEEQILSEMKKYPKLDPFNFYYYLGLAYYDKKRVKQSIKWYERAEAIDTKSFDLMNSFGIAYDEIKEYTKAEQYYLKCLELNPKYHMAYYNLGILYKAQGQVEKTIEYYKKAVEVNPRYNKPYNNLGNIYKDRGQFEKAIEFYKKAVEVHSTYTLCYANMGLCYLKLERYQDAFNALARAKQILPTDNNNLSQGNKAFLKQNLQLFDKEGEKWRKTGSLDPAQKENLRSLIKSFESNFKQLYSSQVSVGVSDQKALKAQILQIVCLLHEDKFQLQQIDRLFLLIKHIFHQDEEYFHILPQTFIQYFWNNSFKQNKPIDEVETNLQKIIQTLSQKESAGNQATLSLNLTFDYKFKNFNPSNNYKANLFKNVVYFKNYEALYSELVKVNALAEKSLSEFNELVEAVRMRSNGIPYGVNMKIPKRTDQQFKVILRILEKMFKKEIDSKRVKSIITKIGQQLKASQDVTLGTIVHEIMDVWTKQITLILQQRQKDKTQTACAISDLVRGKVMFDSIENIRKAVEACDKLCHLHGYQILQFDNRLSKPQTMDVVLKIQVGEAVCELQLAMRQDESKYHLIHSIYEIERSPLGCIFGSYLFMSKGFNYPLLANCKDIEARLLKSQKEEDQGIVKAARFVIQALESKQ